MKCDLHFHTNFSDSSRSLEEALALADDNDLDYIAFTDHDTVETYEAYKKIKDKYRVQAIPAIEVSAYDFIRDRKVHLLVYNYKDISNLAVLTNQVLARRKESSYKQLEDICYEGYKIDKNKIKSSVNSQQTLYKQQIMYALVGQAYETKAYQDLYKKLFKNPHKPMEDIVYIDIFEALEASLKDGGIPVLAHPGQYDAFDLLPDLINRGLRGVEVYHPENSSEDKSRLLKIARDFDLIVTGGSDDHGIFGKTSKVGIETINQSDIDILLGKATSFK